MNRFTPFAQYKMSANLVQSRRKCGANGVNATFALDLHRGCKSWCKCGIYPICTTFATALDQIFSHFHCANMV